MKRIVVLRIVLLFITAALMGRLYQLQLGDPEARRYGSDNIDVITTRYVQLSPRRGEILARDGQTLLAESAPIYSIAVLPGSLPAPDTEQREQVLGKLAQITQMSSTLTISPTQSGTRHAMLWRELDERGYTVSDHDRITTLEVPPDQTLDILDLTGVYSDILTLSNPIEERIVSSNARGYQTVIINEGVSQELAMVIRENNIYLPGVVVVEDYQRRYPQSANVPSLSHMLGYIGRINACELVEQNPSSSWLSSMTDVISYAPECGIINKQITLGSLGLPLYRHDDRIGKDGLEAGYEEVLRGTLGIQKLGVDALERPVSAPRIVQPARDGHNLVLTVDVAFQQQVETILQRWIDEGERRRTNASGYKSDYNPITNGVAVVLDVRSGHVLSMVSLPAYDNNVWVDRSRTHELQALLYPDDPEARAELARLAPLTNSAIAGQYPPGSSIKPLVGSAALQAGVIAPDTRLRDPGRIVLEERSGHIFILPNAVARDNGEITISDALMVSSNVFFASLGGGNDQAKNLGEDATIIRGLHIDGLAQGLQWFSLGEPTGIQLPGEATGRVPTPNWKSHALREPWTTGDTYNASIGQGYLELTPLQLTLATAAIANNGTVYRPQLVQSIVDTEGDLVRHTEPESTGQVPVDDGYLAVVREGMRRSITEGVNVAARDACSGLSIAGKTGTAEFGPVITTEDGKQTRQSHAWFAGFAPYEDPQIAVVVLLEGSGDLDDGSATLAVPAVTQIMQAYFQVVPPADLPQECPDMPE
jgi:penicillin-binding protein 2